MAFAVNRISLIGKDHGKLVQFMVKMRAKKYVTVMLFVCLMFSIVKGFKYVINHDQPEANYPISNEWDIFSSDFTKSGLRDAYFVLNTINDLINNIVFVFVCSGIDIFMVVRFRRTLDEKLKKSESMGHGQKKGGPGDKLDQKRNEFDEAVAKAIKMVVISTSVNLLLKLPLSVVPVINTYAEFYYKDQTKKFVSPTFGRFYSRLFDSGSYEFTIDLADFLFLVSISIQFFIYKKFDKKFGMGYLRLLKKDETAKNGNKNTNTTQTRNQAQRTTAR